MKTIAVILAAGSGSRMSSQFSKQLMKLSGHPVLLHTIRAFLENTSIDSIVVVCPSNALKDYKLLFEVWGLADYPIDLVEGGANRNLSTLNAIRGLNFREAKILIHDGVRPLISQRIINDCIAALDDWEAVDTTIPTADTIVEISEDFVVGVPDRSNLNRGQTPQAFRLSVLTKALDSWEKNGMPAATDDCTLVLRYLPEVKIYKVRGDEANIKITKPVDLYLAEKLFHLKTESVHNIPQFLPPSGAGKVAIVFGGHTGIGAEVSTQLEEIGYYVARISLAQNGIDVTNELEVRKTFSLAREVGPIHLVVNCAATLTLQEFSSFQLEDFWREVEVNFLGSVVVTKCAYEFLRETKGQIFLFSSSSYSRGRSGYAAYSSSKAAIVNFCQSVAEEWQASGIRLNCLIPERTGTPLRKKAFGPEPAETLLEAKEIAASIIRLLNSPYNGAIFEIGKTKLEPMHDE